MTTVIKETQIINIGMKGFPVALIPNLILLSHY